MRDLTKLTRTSFESILFYLLILFLPTQLGKHFWPDFSIVQGIRVDYLSPTLYITDVLTALLFLVWFSNLLKKRTIRLRLSRSTLLYSSFIVLFLYGVFYSGNLPNGLYHLLKLLEFSFIAYFVANALGKTISFEKISFFLAVGVCVESLLAIAQYLNHGSLGGALYFLGERTFTSATLGIANASINGELVLRPYGTFSHPNVLAGYLLLSMLFIFFFLFHKKKYSGFAAVALFFGSSAILLTLSRIAITIWIVFLVAVFVWQIRRALKYRRRQAFGIAVLFVILLTGCWFVFAQTLASRFAQTSLSEESVVQREILTSAALKMIAAQPILGEGLGNFLPVLATISSPFSLSLYLQPVHNIFLLTIAETGLVGFVGLCLLLGLLFYRLFSRMKDPTKIRESFALSIILLCTLLLGQFDHYLFTLQQGQLFFALVIGASFEAGKETFHLGKRKITRNS
jgi:O-antigen ligase